MSQLCYHYISTVSVQLLMTCILVTVMDYILLLLHLCLISSSERYKCGLPLALSPSAMDRCVLLVLLCLQAFLLITAFTSTDAAALVKDDQQQQQQSIDQVRRTTAGH